MFSGWAGSEPTPEECLGFLSDLVASTGRAPSMLAVDVEAAVPLLKRVLGPIGVECGYYAPPSAEEASSLSMGL